MVPPSSNCGKSENFCNFWETNAIGLILSSKTGIYRDPVMASDGPAGIDAMLAGVQAKFPGFVLARTSKVDTHGEPATRYLRFTWSLGPAGGPSFVEGVDFCTLAPDGRLASVVGFIDKMPAT